MSQSTVLLLSCEVFVGVLEELRAFGGGEKWRYFVYFLLLSVKFVEYSLILQKVKAFFTITTFMFEFCVDNLQHIFDRVVLITDLVRRSQNESNVLFVFSFHS